MSLRAFTAALAAAAAAAPHALAQGSGALSEPRPMVRDGKFLMQDGEALYTRLCQGCHMADAKGASGAGVYPALAGDPRLASAAYPIVVILHGQKAMPPFGGFLDDGQIAETVNYIRRHFGNHFSGSVTAAEVRAVR
jgi:mono/diheme cytochrome c family protein